MNFLVTERATLESYLPGLDAQLIELPLLEMERRGNPSIALFREQRGPGLLIPQEYGGKGASLRDAVRIQRALGSRAPSLALATTMHHFSVAALVDITRLRPQPGVEAMLLQQIAAQSLYLASAFAEGRRGAGLFNAQLKVERCFEGLRVRGSKKPCSLSASMDLLTASLVVPAANGGAPQFAVAVIPAATPGLERRPFWQSSILAGAESDEVVLNDVLVPEMQLAYLGDPAQLDAVQLGGFLAFELLVTATYLGIASGLVERALRERRGNASDRVALASELEASIAALEGVARDVGERVEAGLVARALFVRRASQAAIERASNLALEILGGMAFLRQPEITYLLAAARALAFHPPSRQTATAALDRFVLGEELVLSA